jgi:quercetin dioxygenase-like cupin family protein
MSGMMSGAWRRGPLDIPLLSMLTAIGLLLAPAVVGAQSSREADGARLLKGAVDLHFHMDPWTPTATNGQAGIAEVRVAKARGMRALVIKDHNEPTAPLAYHLRPEVPGLELYGGFVLNRANGGVNPAGVEFMATQIRGEPGRIVWMPAGDGAKEVRESKNPDRPFVAVSRNGELLPEVKEVIAIAAKHGLVIASGHIAPEEALMVFREAKRQGVQHLIATHAFDLAGKMTIEQMQEAAKLGAFIEFDFRNTLEGGRIEAIRQVGPEHCFLSEFWTKVTAPKEYAGLEGIGAFADVMRGHGFTDRELDLLFKENPAKALGLAPTMVAAEAPPKAQNKRYFTMPLEKDPTREVGLQAVTLPPGAGNQFHRHPGDQWTAVQEGEVTFTVKGQPPQVLKAGESNYVPRGTIHRQQNLGDKPARYIEMRVFDKGKPASEQMTD